MEPEFVTRHQLITTCLSTAAAAVLLGWALARPDVWALQESIDRLSSIVRELKVQQTQNVTLGYDRAPLVGQIAQRLTERTHELHTGTMRGIGSPSDRPAGGSLGHRSGTTGTAERTELGPDGD